MNDIKQRVAIFIPARYASQRFDGKLLELIGERTILHHVYNRVIQSTLASSVTIVVDDNRLEQEAKYIEAATIMSEGVFRCGSDRCMAAYQDMAKDDILINVQADQPFIDPKIIDQLISTMISDTSIEIASLRTKNKSRAKGKQVVKVSIDDKDDAVDFYRVLPLDPDVQKQDLYRHIGVYGFRKSAVDQIRKLDISKREEELSLEQLRWLDHGMKIRMVGVDYNPLSVDQPEDLKSIIDQYEG